MVITILAAGSQGDTQPYIALGTALKKRGVNVRMATFEAFRQLVEDANIELHPVKGDINKVASSEMTADARQADNPFKVLLSFNKLKTLVFNLQKDLYDACAGSDAIIYHPGAAIGFFIAKKFNIPSILAAPFPMAPTREYPSLLFYNGLHLGRRFNILTHKIFEQIMWLGSKSAIQSFWMKEFNSLPEDFSCPFPKQNTQRLPTINSCSNYVFARPNDWPQYVYNTGYWFSEDEKGWNPPSELLNFLHNGKPPVYVGFGSMSDPDNAVQTTKTVIQALQRSNQRGILATGWQGMAHLEKVPEEIFILKSAPHAWLFPQMTAVVHHGGAGTTAAGLRAGAPNVVVPFSNDQFAWGRRVFELGVSPKPIPKKNLSTENLTDALNYVQRVEIQEKAKEMGIKIQSENGVEKAADIILQTFDN